MAISKLHSLLALSGVAAVGVPVATVFVLNSQEEVPAAPETVPSTERADSTPSAPISRTDTEENQKTPTPEALTEGQQPDTPTTPTTPETTPSAPESRSPDSEAETTTQTQPTAPTTPIDTGTTGTTPTTTPVATTTTCTAPTSGFWSNLYKNITTKEDEESKKLKRWEDFMKSQGKNCQGQNSTTGTESTS